MLWLWELRLLHEKAILYDSGWTLKSVYLIDIYVFWRHCKCIARCQNIMSTLRRHYLVSVTVKAAQCFLIEIKLSVILKILLRWCYWARAHASSRSIFQLPALSKGKRCLEEYNLNWPVDEACSFPSVLMMPGVPNTSVVMLCRSWLLGKYDGLAWKLLTRHQDKLRVKRMHIHLVRKHPSWKSLKGW